LLTNAGVCYDWPPRVLSPGLFHTRGKGRMRYVVALAVAALVVSGGILYVHLESEYFHQVMQEAYRRRAEQAAAQGAEADTRPAISIHSTLPANVQWRMKLVMFLSDYGFLLAPLTVAGCAATAAMIGRVRKANR
jgi:hypothetical protein